MKKSDAFPSPYLKSVDVSGVGQDFTIKGLSMEEFNDPDTKEKEVKPVIYFLETQKGFVLNKTNWNRVEELHGPESDAWTGKKVKLHLEQVESFGKMVDGIRVVEAAQVKKGLGRKRA